LISSHSHHQNKLIFGGLSRMLASRDILLILRFFNPEAKCDEYWALVPPVAEQPDTSSSSGAAGNDSHSQLLHGLDLGNSDEHRVSYVVEGDGNGRRGGGGCETQSSTNQQTEHMVLIKLVDRDELLLDSCERRTSLDSKAGRNKQNRERNEDALPGGGQIIYSFNAQNVNNRPPFLQSTAWMVPRPTVRSV
jgi:hypothetical protein